MKKFALGMGLLLSVLLVFGGIFYGNIIAVFWLIPRVMEWLEPLGIGKYFTLVLAIPFAVWISLSIGKILSFSKEKRLQGIAMAVGVVVILALLLGVMTRNHRFDPHDGSPQYAFSRDINGEVKILPKTTKFDPETGMQTMPLMPNVVQEGSVLKNGIPSFAPLSISRNSQFFAPDGSPLFYYHEYPDGRIEFFPHGGCHPQTGDPLLPVDKRIVAKFHNYLSSGRVSLIVGYDGHFEDVPSIEGGTSSYQSSQQGGLHKLSNAYNRY